MLKSHSFRVKEPKRAKKEPKRASFLKFNYGNNSSWYNKNYKDQTIKKVLKTLVFLQLFNEILYYFFLRNFFWASPPPSKKSCNFIVFLNIFL